MATEFKLPELGENIESADIVNVLVKVGDSIEKEQSIIEIETDKATIEVPSNVSGKITEVLVKQGDSVKVGQTIIKVDEGASSDDYARLNDDLILVHDAARPLLPDSILTKAINTAKEKGNALVCLKARDTLLKGDQLVSEYIDRSEMYYVQTPQIFKYGDLMKAMKKAYEKNFIGTDESMLIKELGIDINIVEGSMLNFKVTTATEIEMFEKLIAPNQ